MTKQQILKEYEAPFTANKWGDILDAKGLYFMGCYGLPKQKINQVVEALNQYWEKHKDE